MSDSVESPRSDVPASRSRRGQSLVEFALVLPMLLVLLLGVADFGRVFAAGVVLEASARNAAEAAAQEYLQLCRNRSTCPPLDHADYVAIHEVAREEACREAQRLPNRAVDGSGNCYQPAIAVCIHDGHDTLCAHEAAGAPGDCTALHAMSSSPSNPAPALYPGEPALPYVEVVTCYQFTTLFALSDLDLPLGWSISLGDVWLQRDRTFTVADY
ncbi:MAG TPA: TadE/TadG family type IV pilus assembly protein [Glaciibacter sp.]|nr:TadE/TadG family type IV pilus assembly protein [Glaciibacter sp.]